RGVPTRAPLDWAGALLAAVGLGGVVYALLESSNLGWRNAKVAGALAMAVVALAALVAVERRVPGPMLRLELFKSRTVAGAHLAPLCPYGALSGVLVFLPLNLIQVQGYSAAAAGASLLPIVLLMFGLSRWSGGLLDRMGPRRPLVAGCSAAAIGLALFAMPGVGGSYWST